MLAQVAKVVTIQIHLLSESLISNGWTVPAFSKCHVYACAKNIQAMGAHRNKRLWLKREPLEPSQHQHRGEANDDHVCAGLRRAGIHHWRYLWRLGIRKNCQVQINELDEQAVVLVVAQQRSTSLLSETGLLPLPTHTNRLSAVSTPDTRRLARTPQIPSAPAARGILRSTLW